MSKSTIAKMMELKLAELIAEQKRQGAYGLVFDPPSSTEWKNFQEQLDINLVAAGLRVIEIKATPADAPTELPPPDEPIDT